jgi:hypothetical protein
MFVKTNIAQTTLAELLYSFKGWDSECDRALVDRTSPRNDIAHARHVPSIFKKSVWRNFTLGRVHRLKIETMGIKFPKVPYCFATVEDWYMAIEMTGGREPLSIVWRIGIVSPRRESAAATRMHMGLLG